MPPTNPSDARRIASALALSFAIFVVSAKCVGISAYAQSAPPAQPAPAPAQPAEADVGVPPDSAPFRAPVLPMTPAPTLASPPPPPRPPATVPRDPARRLHPRLFGLRPNGRRLSLPVPAERAPTTDDVRPSRPAPGARVGATPAAETPATGEAADEQDVAALAAGAQTILDGAHEPTPATAATPVDDPTRTRVTALPGIFYAPETSVGFGASAGAFFDIARPATPGPRLWSRSWVLVAGAYTLNRQAILAVFPYLVFRQGRIVVDGEIDVRRFPNRHFGFGRDAEPDNLDFQTYTKEAVSVGSSVLVQVIPRLYVGGSLGGGVSRFVDAGEPPFDAPDQRWLGSGQVSGERGAGLVGFGLRTYYDGRDHARMTRRGYYAELQHLSYLRPLGSTHAFHSLVIDLRGYVPIARRAGFAAQLQSLHSFGDVPFERLAFVGGPRGMRAYRLGRFVDTHHSFVRAELRFPIAWRFRGAVGTELGFIYGKAGRPRFGSPLWDVVAGLRFVVREADRLVVRADLAYGVTGFAGVLYLNEAF